MGNLHDENAAAETVQPDIQRLQALQPKLVALSPHDSEAPARQAFRTAFTAIYHDVVVGQPLRLGSAVAYHAEQK